MSNNDVAESDYAELEGEILPIAARGISGTEKRYWGEHMWARGYFCGTVGEVGQETIAKYIENQGKEENADNFTVTT